MASCRLYEAEHILTDWYDKCDDFSMIDIDEEVALAVCDKGVYVPAIKIYVKGGVVCVRDEISGIYMPEDKVTVLMRDKSLCVDKEIMYMADNVVEAVAGYLQDSVGIREREQYECIFEE